MADNKETDDADDEQSDSTVRKLIAGGIIGAVIGILSAPRAGSELRADISRRSQAWRTRTGEFATTLRGQVGPAVNSLRGLVKPAAERVRDRVVPLADQVDLRMRAGRDGPEAGGEKESEARQEPKIRRKDKSSRDPTAGTGDGQDS